MGKAGFDAIPKATVSETFEIQACVSDGGGRRNRESSNRLEYKLMQSTNSKFERGQAYI